MYFRCCFLFWTITLLASSTSGNWPLKLHFLAVGCSGIHFPFCSITKYLHGLVSMYGHVIIVGVHNSKMDHLGQWRPRHPSDKWWVTWDVTFYSHMHPQPLHSHAPSLHCALCKAAQEQDYVTMVIAHVHSWLHDYSGIPLPDIIGSQHFVSYRERSPAQYGHVLRAVC